MSDFRLKIQAELDATGLTEQLNALKNTKIPLKFTANGLENLDSKTLKYIDKLKSKDVSVNLKVTGKREIESITQDLQNLKTVTTNVKINTKNSGSSTKDTINDFQVLKNLASEIGTKKINLAKLDISKNANQIKELSSQITKLGSDYNELFKLLSKNLNAKQFGELEQITGKTSDRVAELTAKMKDMVEQSEKTASSSVKQFNILDAYTASNRTQKFVKENTKLTKEYREALLSLADAQKSATSAEQLSSLNKQYRKITSEAKNLGVTGKSFKDSFLKSFGQIFQFSGIYGAIQNVIFEIPRQMVSSVQDVDTAMTNLYKVTDETASRYEQFQNTAAKTSQSIGRSMSSYITQVSEWSKLGYTMDQSEELAKNSSIYSNVGEVEDTRAVSDLVTAMKAFNIEASNSITIVDSLNKLGNNYAVSSADLGEGLSNSASALASAGNDINQSLAMLTGMTEITQSAGESGNALKILSMRLRGYDEETESYSNDTEELSGKIADLTKTAKTPGGISLFTDETKTTYKSTYQLLKDISEIYDSLTDKNRARLLEVMAGKSRGNQVAALLQAFKSGQVEKAYNDSVNSEGSAQQEQDKWMESIEAKIEKFKASFQELSTNVISSGLFKGVIDSGTTLVSVLNEIVSVGNGIPAIFASIAGASIFKNWD